MSRPPLINHIIDWKSYGTRLVFEWNTDWAGLWTACRGYYRHFSKLESDILAAICISRDGCASHCIFSSGNNSSQKVYWAPRPDKDSICRTALGMDQPNSSHCIISIPQPSCCSKYQSDHLVIHILTVTGPCIFLSPVEHVFILGSVVPSLWQPIIFWWIVDSNTICFRSAVPSYISSSSWSLLSCSRSWLSCRDVHGWPLGRLHR